jgi:acetyltransferase-like isoleucine patch superfamily enzyme
VRLGENVELGHNVLIRENVNVGNNTLIGTNVAVDGHCNIGSNVSIQTGVYISAYCTVKDTVFLGPNCMLLNDKYMKQAKYKLRGPTVQEGASIGGNAVIMPMVTVGKGAVVGAGSVVVKNVKPKTIVAGVPAVELKKTPESWSISECPR